MLVGGDLGFSYLVLVVLLLGPVIGFVLRRKWRLSVARREEIKRLLVLASEETARAELEASTGYSSNAAYTPAVSQPLQYQCAVCFSPTTTRCARCKSVRYCSGKCQIIHWRQGHREECRPFIYQNIDSDSGSFPRVLKQEEYEIDGDNFETEVRQPAKSAQNVAEEPVCEKSDNYAEVSCGNVDCEVECFAETKQSDEHQSNNISHGKLTANSVDNMGQNDQASPKPRFLVDSVDQSAMSETSSPSSGSDKGVINSCTPKVDAIDDFNMSNSSGVANANMQSSSCNFERNAMPFINVQDSCARTVTLGDAKSTPVGIRKAIDRPVLSQEVNGDASRRGRSPILVSEKSDKIDVCGTSDSATSKSSDPGFSSVTFADPTSGVGRNSVGTREAKVHSIPSFYPERSNQAFNNASTTRDMLKSKEDRSLSSGDSIAHVSSSGTKGPAVQGANVGQVDGAHVVGAASVFESHIPNDKNDSKISMRKVIEQLSTCKSSRHHHLGVGSEIAGRYSNKGQFPYELFVKLYNWNKIELRPRGLINCGNSCFANAVLQCLAHTRPLTAYFLHGLHSKACERKGWCFTCEFESLILKSREGDSPLSPIGILSQIQNIGSHLSNGREEDAHEFLRYAIDKMQSVCLKEATTNASSTLEEETTLIGLTFGGYLRSKIKCIKCGGKSERDDRMMDLTVEIEGDIDTLEDALRQFTRTEVLEGENKYHCSRCRSYERAKKKLTILEAPNILTIALKRFQSGKFGKLNKSVQFPETLNLAPYMCGTSDKSPIYNLYGVVVHLDIMNAAFSGHYVCYVKNVQNKWFKIDDSMVKAVDLDSVLKKRAYMLLYARCSPRAPRLIRNSISPNDPRRLKNPMCRSRSHLLGPRDGSALDPLNGHTGIECLYPNHASFQPSWRILEEDSSSDNSSSIFSEECSCSTESSNRDSSSADDFFDQIFGDGGRNWNSLWKNLSDSDSSSSSSSSPLYSRHSPLADSDRYSSGHPEADGNGFWDGLPSRGSNWEGKSTVPILYSDTSKQCRNLVSKSSCSGRETDSDRLGRANPFDNQKSGVSFRRPPRDGAD
ncbi:Ubiquitinyl hydrolase 1 [Bertholletia excelsa]